MLLFTPIIGRKPSFFSERPESPNNMKQQYRSKLKVMLKIHSHDYQLCMKKLTDSDERKSKINRWSDLGHYKYLMAKKVDQLARKLLQCKIYQFKNELIYSDRGMKSNSFKIQVDIVLTILTNHISFFAQQLLWLAF